MSLDEKKDLWRRILTALQAKMRPGDFRAWLKNTAILNAEPGALTIGCPSEISRAQLAGRYHELILEAAREIDEKIEFLDYRVESKLANGSEETISLGGITGAIKRAFRREQVHGIEIAKDLRSRALNPELTFEKFIAPAEDRLAVSAAQAVAERPGKAYNPLFIYGGVGLGKTHLLHAIGNRIAREKNAMVVYVSSEQFTNEIIAAIRGGLKKIEKFREKFRKVDALLVDDIQFFANKESTQQEFFHTFNVLHEAGKQIVLAADRPPRELLGFDARLTSRFASGMTVDVHPPAFETRVAILQEFFSREGAIVPEESLLLAAENLKTSVRELRGFATQVAARCQLAAGEKGEGWKPTPEAIAELLRAVGARISSSRKISLPAGNSPTAEDALAVAAEFFQLRLEDLISSSRKAEAVRARGLAAILCREELGLSLEKIGNAFGGRSHATILHAIEKLQKEMILDPNGVLVEHLDAVRQRLRTRESGG